MLFDTILNDLLLYIQSTSVLNFVGLALSQDSCHCPFGVQNIFSLVFRKCKIHSRGYFVGSKCFLVGNSWVQKTFSQVFRGFKIVSCGYFVGRRYFLVGILKVQNTSTWVFRVSKFFFSRLFHGSEIFSVEYFVGPKFYSFQETLVLNKKIHVVEDFQQRVLSKQLSQWTLSNHYPSETETIDYDLTDWIFSNLVIHILVNDICREIE